jgi:hypothetical protein
LETGPGGSRVQVYVVGSCVQNQREREREKAGMQGGREGGKEGRSERGKVMNQTPFEAPF